MQQFLIIVGVLPTGTQSVDGLSTQLKKGCAGVRCLVDQHHECVCMHVDRYHFSHCLFHTTEVNASTPNAIDRHVRVVQWQHGCRDKCRCYIAAIARRLLCGCF